MWGTKSQWIAELNKAQQRELMQHRMEEEHNPQLYKFKQAIGYASIIRGKGKEVLIKGDGHAMPLESFLSKLEKAGVDPSWLATHVKKELEKFDENQRKQLEKKKAEEAKSKAYKQSFYSAFNAQNDIPTTTTTTEDKTTMELKLINLNWNATRSNLERAVASILPHKSWDFVEDFVAQALKLSEAGRKAFIKGSMF